MAKYHPDELRESTSSITEELETIDIEDDLETLLPKEISDVSEGIAHRPTLIIGLGGAGCEAVLRVKKKLLARFGEMQTLSFLFMDTDTKTFAKMPGLPSIETNEQIYIGGEQAIKAYKKPNLFKEIAERIPRDLDPGLLERLADGRGTGQIRVLGALCFLSSFERIKSKITQAISQIEEMRSILQDRLGKKSMNIIAGDIIVYIVGSLAGGTGCGAFLDTTVLIKHLVKGTHANIIGIFMLPEGFFSKVRGDEIQIQRMKTNCYAALKEIQFFLDTSTVRQPITFRYPTMEEAIIEGETQLWDLCYLVDFKDEQSRRLSKLEDLFDVVSRQLFHEIGSPFGAEAASFTNNATSLSGIAPCQETKKQRRFSTFSTACLAFPAQRIMNYSTWRTLETFCNDVLMGQEANTEDVEKGVAAFLSSNGLEERGSENQVISGLLMNRGVRVTSNTYGLSLRFGRRKNAQEFAAFVSKKKQEFEAEDIPKLRQKIEENFKKLLPEKQGLIRDFVASRFGGRGTEYCIQLLDHAALVFRTMREEMLEENREWRDRLRKNTESVMKENLAKLKKLWSVIAMLSNRDENLKVAIVKTFNDYIDGEILSLARDCAQSLFERLEASVSKERARISSLDYNLKSLSFRLRSAIAQIEAAGRRKIGDFVVELDVTEPGYDKRYYESHRVPSETVLEACQKAFGDFYEALSDKSLAGIVKLLLPICKKYYKEELERTNIVEFLKDRSRGGSRNCEIKLQEIFEMCQPFWLTDIPGNISYSDYIALGVEPIDKRKQIFDPIISKWIRKYQDARSRGARGRADIVPTSIPYEIELSRRTHGARAYYLRDARNWKKFYTNILKAGTYPLHVHPDLPSVADLFPDLKAASRISFAVAMSLGFIAKRGNHYYYNIDIKRNSNADFTEIVLLYESDWPTIPHNIMSDPSRSGDAKALGSLMKLVMKTAKPPKDRYLGSGREKSMIMFMNNDDWRAGVDEAYSAFVSLMGQANVTRDLDWYRDELEKMDVPRELRTLLRKEKEAIAKLIEDLKR